MAKYTREEMKEMQEAADTLMTELNRTGLLKAIWRTFGALFRLLLTVATLGLFISASESVIQKNNYIRWRLDTADEDAEAPKKSGFFD